MRKLGVVSGVLGALGLVLPAAADSAPSDKLAHDLSPVKTAPKAACQFTDKLPPLPAGCTAPTLADCKSVDWANSACVKAHPAEMAPYCKKEFVTEYCKDDRSEVLVFPGKQPGDALDFVPPGHEVGGKQAPYVQLTAPRFSGKVVGGPLVRRPVPSLSVAGGELTVRAVGRGSYKTTILPLLVQASTKSSNLTVKLYDVGLSNASLTGVEIAPLFDKESQWVGDGTDTADHRRVGSCEEFVYQRWYDYERYRFAAARMGRNYRAMYSAAVDPSSPVFLDRPTLHQFATGVLPAQLPNSTLPHNAFLGVYPDWLDRRLEVPQATRDAIKARINGFFTTMFNGLIRTPTRMQVAAPASKLELHKKLKQMMDIKYGAPSDDWYDELSGRVKTYTELLAQREHLLWQIACKRGLCNPKVPLTAPAGFGKVPGPGIINQIINGGGVIPGRPGDPGGDFTGASRFAQSLMTRIDRYDRSFATTQLQASAMMRTRAATKNAAAMALPAPRVRTTAAVARGHVRTDEEALADVEDRLTKLILAEWQLGDKGCLEDPRGELGNRCDWSYEVFAHQMLTVFDDNEQSDFQACSDAVGGSFNVMKYQPPTSSRIFPCTARRDFSVDQVSAEAFVEATAEEASRRSCEASRRGDMIKDYLAANADIVAKLTKRANGIGNQYGDNWGIGDASTFRVSAKYGADWQIKANKVRADGVWCNMNAHAAGNASAEVDFFGQTLNLFDAAADGTADDSSGVTYSMHVDYEDMTTLTRETPIDQKPTNIPMPQLPFQKPLLDPPKLIGEIKTDFWISAGPIPIHVQVGANATAGVDFTLDGTTGDKCAAAGAAGYKLGAVFNPYVRGDVFADGSVDVGVASAGIRLDLLLLKLGVPVQAGVAMSDAKSIGFGVDGNLSADALAGRLSAYAEISWGLGSKSWETTIAGWDGIHYGHSLFNLTTDAPIPLDLVSYVANPSGSAGSLVCVPNPHPPGPFTPVQCSQRVGEPGDKGYNEGCDPQNPVPSASCKAYFPSWTVVPKNGPGPVVPHVR